MYGNIKELERFFPNLNNLPVFTVKAKFVIGTRYLEDEEGNQYIIANHRDYSRTLQYKYYLLKPYDNKFVILKVFTDFTEPYRLNNIYTIQKAKVITLKEV